jgi:hypothetical protein
MVNKLKNTFSISMIAFALLATTSVAFAEDATTTASSTPPATVPNPYLSSAVVEARVRQYFADSAVMVSIAKCESGFRQFNSDGTPLDGGSGGSGSFSPANLIPPGVTASNVPSGLYR